MGAVAFQRRIENLYDPSGRPLSDFAEGSIVKLKENGTPVEFYVACHNYESGNNGLGRTLLVRKDIKENVAFAETATSNVVYGGTSCTLSNWMTTYATQLDAAVQGAIGTTTIPVATKFGNTGGGTLGTISVAAFQLSAAELGFDTDYGLEEGSRLPIDTLLTIAELNGEPSTQWTRTKYVQFTQAYSYYVTNAGKAVADAKNQTATYGARPAFTLPETVKIKWDGSVAVA